MLNNAIRKLHDTASSPRGKGKYEGHPLWSKEAEELVKREGLNKKGDYPSKLAHEHMVPVNVICQILLDQDKNLSVEHFKGLIKQYSAVAIVTKEQDKHLDSFYRDKMPEDWDKKDVFARYRKASLFDNLKLKSE